MPKTPRTHIEEPADPPPPRWITMADYADLTGISLSKVKRLKLEGRLPYIQEGRVVRIPIQATDFDWLQTWRDQNLN